MGIGDRRKQPTYRQAMELRLYRGFGEVCTVTRTNRNGVSPGQRTSRRATRRQSQDAAERAEKKNASFAEFDGRSHEANTSQKL